MRVPLSWVLAYAALADPVDAGEVARRLTAAGLEVESVEPAGHEVRGVVVARVDEVEELTGFRKPVRYCQMSVGDERSGVVCGAVNFAAGDKVALARPGAVLPGGFEIGAKQAYGRMSEGMICSARELGIGDDHTGILVLEDDAPLGEDFAAWAGLADHVLDIAVNPDRGYALSVRGVAREVATAFGVAFTDPVDVDLPDGVAACSPEVYPASIADPGACDRFVLREVRGLDPAAPAPLWMRLRLARCGVRSVSLAVDVTNYLMIELGQPLHAFDRARLTGPIVVRRARPGERLETLDHIDRELHPDDILITDDSGPIGLAGTMGGVATEVSEQSTDLVVEAAHFSATGVALMSRRHKLASEASYRFERGVDRELPLRASAKAAALLASLGGASVLPGCTHAQVEVPPVTVTMAADYPDQVAGQAYGRDTVVRRLHDVGCEVSAVRQTPADPATGLGAQPGLGTASGQAGESDALRVTPPSWRPDLLAPSDLAEEVIRLEGYENVGIRSPRAAAGRGLTRAQRLRRSVGRGLADAGYVEVLSLPFGAAEDWDRLLLPEDDPRRRAARLANPLSEDEPCLRTTLLPGLLRTLAFNLGRGSGDLALYETGQVFRLRPGAPPRAPILAVDRGPGEDELASVAAALPEQPLHVAAVLAGERELPGWWGPGRRAGWQDAVDAAREVLRVSRVPFMVGADQEAPWHPGRCAAVFITDKAGQLTLVGHAGELHPRVVEAFRLPARTCAMELDLSAVESAAGRLAPVTAPRVSAYPVATQDVALVVDAGVPAAAVEAALSRGAAQAGETDGASAGSMLEDIRLFDVYTGEQVGEGRKSLAYTLRFRAPDRTLTDEEAIAARDAAVAEAAREVGAVLRGSS